MNRRSFVLSASMLTAFAGSQALAQRGSRSASDLTSELTGGKVDISGTSLEMVNHHIDEADGSEHIHFTIENEGQFDIYFWPQSNGDGGQFTKGMVDMFLSVAPEGEILGSDDYDDGGYFAFNAIKLGYYEYQRNAYPGHDLLALFYANADIFEENFTDAQNVLIDGMGPFLFHEDADILTIAATQAEASSTGTNGTSRTSRGSATTDTQESADTGNSRETRASTATDDNPVDVVNTHRDGFWSSYGEFYDLLDAIAADDATDREIEDAWMLMLNIALEWQNYPAEAAKVEFTPDYATLETAYLDWADGIGLLGSTFEGYSLEKNTIDDFLDANEAMALLDEALQIELGDGTRAYSVKRETIALLHRRDRTKTIA